MYFYTHTEVMCLGPHKQHRSSGMLAVVDSCSAASTEKMHDRAVKKIILWQSTDSDELSLIDNYNMRDHKSSFLSSGT